MRFALCVFRKRLIAQEGVLVKERGLLVKAHCVRSGRKSIANVGCEMWDVRFRNADSGMTSFGGHGLRQAPFDLSSGSETGESNPPYLS